MKGGRVGFMEGIEGNPALNWRSENPPVRWASVRSEFMVDGHDYRQVQVLEDGRARYTRNHSSSEKGIVAQLWFTGVFTALCTVSAVIALVMSDKSVGDVLGLSLCAALGGMCVGFFLSYRLVSKSMFATDMDITEGPMRRSLSTFVAVHDRVHEWWWNWRNLAMYHQVYPRLDLDAGEDPSWSNVMGRPLTVSRVVDGEHKEFTRWGVNRDGGRIGDWSHDPVTGMVVVLLSTGRLTVPGVLGCLSGEFTGVVCKDVWTDEDQGPWKAKVEGVLRPQDFTEEDWILVDGVATMLEGLSGDLESKFRDMSRMFLDCCDGGELTGEVRDDALDVLGTHMGQVLSDAVVAYPLPVKADKLTSMESAELESARVRDAALLNHVDLLPVSMREKYGI